MPRSRLLLAVLAAAQVLVLGAAVAAVATHRPPRQGAPAADSNGGWDPRVVDLVRYVEREKSLRFSHAVPVEFLKDTDFRHKVLEDDSADTAADEADAEREAAVFRALGLIGADVDLGSAADDLAGDGIIGLYDPDRERVFVRGDKLTVDTRVTLVHELTHALQDQAFVLPSFDDLPTDGARLGLRAVLEGDASAVEAAYVESELSATERKAYESSQEAGADAAYDEAPPALVSMFEAPYALGGSFLTYLDAGGEADVDDALRSPPTTDLQLLRPQTYLTGQDALDVHPLRLRAGESAVPDGSGDFGALSWYLVLGQRVDPRVALEAADGWGGDAYVQFTRGGRDCLRAVFTGQSAAATNVMADALHAWVRGHPEAHVQSSSNAVELESCDPGKRAIPGRDGDLLTLPALRTYFEAQLLTSGATVKQVACGGRALLRLTPLPTLLNPPEAGFDSDPAFVKAARAAVAGCTSR